jgi:hypothetical protein
VGIAASMKELTGNILSSSKERGQRLSNLREETMASRREAANQVKEYSAARLDARAQLQKQLRQSTADRKKQVNQSLKASQNLIKHLQTERKRGGAQLRKDLASGMDRLAGEEKTRKLQVKTMLNQVSSARRDTAVQLKADLAQSRLDRQTTVKDALDGAGSMVDGYRSARMRMRSNQQKVMGRENGDRQAEVKDLLGGFRGTRGKMRTELNQASFAWKGMRSGAAKETKSVKVTSPALGMEEKLLKIVKRKASGVTLAEAGQSLGLATILLAKAAKSLKDSGKIRKEGKIYFPKISG